MFSFDLWVVEQKWGCGGKQCGILPFVLLVESLISFVAEPFKCINLREAVCARVFHSFGIGRGTLNFLEEAALDRPAG